MRFQAITWTNVDVWSIRHLGTNFGEIWVKIRRFSFTNACTNVVCKMSAILFRPQCDRQAIDCVDWLCPAEDSFIDSTDSIQATWPRLDIMAWQKHDHESMSLKPFYPQPTHSQWGIRFPSINHLATRHLKLLFFKLISWTDILSIWKPFRRQHFSNAFCVTKMYEFRSKFHWSLFLRVHLTIFQHWFR